GAAVVVVVGVVFVLVMNGARRVKSTTLITVVMSSAPASAMITNRDPPLPREGCCRGGAAPYPIPLGPAGRMGGGGDGPLAFVLSGGSGPLSPARGIPPPGPGGCERDVGIVPPCPGISIGALTAAAAVAGAMGPVMTIAASPLSIFCAAC